jgi:triphosphoribosyl-dephospho-CoA synthase
MMTSLAIVNEEMAEKLAWFAVEALLQELHLTPKPGLVDRKNSGAHRDMSLSLMEVSAYGLRRSFFKMALAAACKQPSQHLRERLAAIGRHGEKEMLQATDGVNTHKGAIWTLGLLTAASGMLFSQRNPRELACIDVLQAAGAIAAFEDRYAPKQVTNGDGVRNRFGVRGARAEAAACFPSLRKAALPAWGRYSGEAEQIRNLNILLSLMAVVNDTCILHRSNGAVLAEVKRRAKCILTNGGLGLPSNWELYSSLDRFIMDNGVSPGGSADLLAATLLLQKLVHYFKIT